MFRYFSITALLFFILSFSQVHAQTLMTLTTSFEFSIHKAQSRSFEMTWYFDKNASTSLLIAFDTNSDSQYRGQEKLDLIRMLKQFETQNYLIQLKRNESFVKTESIRVISLDVDNSLVSVTFGVQLEQAVDLQKTGLSLAFVGNERIAIKQNAVRYKLTGMLAENCNVKVLENPSIDSHNWYQIFCTR
jgi:ABC-type uncharacterized transport system substrate-binding protein